MGRPVVVSGGYGLLWELENDGEVAKVVGHGPPDGVRWLSADMIVREATPETVRYERQQAASRGVSCNNPDCWCRAY